MRKKSVRKRIRKEKCQANDEENSVRKSKNGVLSERPHFLVWHGICFGVSKPGKMDNE